MATTMSQVKPLKGKQAKEFKKAFEMSGVKKESIPKAINVMKNLEEKGLIEWHGSNRSDPNQGLLTKKRGVTEG